MKRTLILTTITALGLTAVVPFSAHAAERNLYHDKILENRYSVIEYQNTDSSGIEDIVNNIQDEIKNYCLPDWKVITIPVICKPDLVVPDICQPGTDNSQPGTDNSQPGTDNSQPGTDNSQPGTDSSQPGTDNSQPETDNSKPGTDNSKPETEEVSFAEQVVALVNEERAKAGLNPVTLDESIEAAALIRAKEIETRFSHTRPDGSSFSTVLTENGISYRGSGENIAWGQTSPEAVMNAWMNSSGHRANILNPNFTKIGVGHYQNGAGRNHWVQLFVY